MFYLNVLVILFLTNLRYDQFIEWGILSLPSVIHEWLSYLKKMLILKKKNPRLEREKYYFFLKANCEILW